MRRRFAEEQLTILKGQLWVTRVGLHLALRGDWIHRDVAEQHRVRK